MTFSTFCHFLFWSLCSMVPQASQTSVPQTIEMDKLPDELLVHIFKYVPQKDRRRAVRLVCRRWNRITEDKALTRDEIIPLYQEYLDEVLAIFQLSRRTTYDLHLKYIQFNNVSNHELSHEFWRSHGWRIRSLVFENCVHLNFSIFCRIILLCPNVKHVSFICDSLCDCSWLKSFTSTYLTAKSVISFSCRMIIAHESSLRDILSTILSFFPNLERLKIDLPTLYHQIYQPSSVPRLLPARLGLIQGQKVAPFEDELPLALIANYIRSRSKKLKKLWLMQSRVTTYRNNTFADFMKLLSRLKELEELTVAGHQFLRFNKLQRPESLLMQLPKLVVLNLADIPTDFEVGNILDRVLDSAPNLQDLRLSFSATFDSNQSQVEKLLLSKLKRFHLMCQSTVGTTHNIRGPLPVNSTLEELHIAHKERRERNCLFTVITRYLRNLRYLALTHLHDEDLQNIFKNHRFLRSLIMDICDGCSDFGYIGRRKPSSKYSDSVYTGFENSNEKLCSIAQLKDLEFLRITDMNLQFITSKTPLSFYLPKLKRLDMDILQNYEGVTYNTPFVDDLMKAITQLYLLEALQLRLPTALSLRKMKKLLNSLKRLSFLSLHFNRQNDKKPSEKRLRELFKTYPTLNFLVFQCHIYARKPVKGSPSSSAAFRHILPKWSDADGYNLLPACDFKNFRFDC